MQETTTYPPGQEYHPDNYVSAESVRLHAEEIMRDPSTYIFGVTPSNVGNNNLVNSYQDWLDEDSPTRETDIYEYRYNVWQTACRDSRHIICGADDYTCHSLAEEFGLSD